MTPPTRKRSSPRWRDLKRQEEQATARPYVKGEFQGLPYQNSDGNRRKLVKRPDADGFTLSVDGNEDPPIASVFDDYGGSE